MRGWMMGAFVGLLGCGVGRVDVDVSGGVDVSDVDIIVPDGREEDPGDVVERPDEGGGWSEPDAVDETLGPVEDLFVDTRQEVESVEDVVGLDAVEPADTVDAAGETVRGEDPAGADAAYDEVGGDALDANEEADGAASGRSLRFFGHGRDDRDRVKIRVDDPTNAAPGPPIDVGATDFTIELWVRGLGAENGAGSRSCGANVDWIFGNVLIDRDRYNQGRKFGVSFVDGRTIFGVTVGSGSDFTVCGSTKVLDGQWRHLAIQRRLDGRMEIWVDGQLDASGAGPAGDLSYPDDGVPGPYCGGPCTFSDPFLVIGAEKHDAGPEYPSFSGWVDELRISTTLRYHAPFVPSRSPFVPDLWTVGLYHFDEPDGELVLDASGHPGGPSHGELHVGGPLGGPLRSTETPLGGP